MSVKWTGSNSQSETGILRKSEFKERKEELFVFGYSCKLFRDDVRALHIDQGKHLIPWMGDETLKIDRYDARGALHDLSTVEAPQGGFDWRVELTKSEHDVEQLCDEERYRALHTDEEEEMMYKEEELKRLHKAGYGQVGFNYDAPAEPTPVQPTEVDEEPFVPTTVFKELMPIDTVFPETVKQNAIIEKTSKFIANQGAQMEILIKAKQHDNPQFNFLNKADLLHPYYMALTALVKAGKWPEKKIEVVEEKPPEPEEYLHPSLAATVIESAPSIPSIHYKPSADCDYTMLISKMRGDGELAPGELPPPGTEPATAPGTVIARAPVLYNTSTPPPPSAPADNQILQQQQYALYYQQYMSTLPPVAPSVPPSFSTGLSLMKSYDSGSDSNPSDSEEETKTNGSKLTPLTPEPPDDIKTVIQKMASYVARNGDEFADIVRAKNDPRFTFLEPSNVYHAYYNKMMQQMRGVDVNGTSERKGKESNLNTAPVSFSIKKLKEPDPILPKPALPYESSTDDEEDKISDKASDKTSDKTSDKAEKPEAKPTVHIENQQSTFNQLPNPIQIPNMIPIVVYKMDGQLTQNLPTVRAVEHTKQYLPKPPELKVPTIENIEQQQKPEPKEAIEHNTEHKPEEKIEILKTEIVPEKIERKESPKRDRTPHSPIKERREKAKDIDRDSPAKRREKKRHKEYRSKSTIREYKSKTAEKRREREKERERKRQKEKDDLESEIISLEDNSDDLIDLTGDQSDCKVEADAESEKAKQLERRRRAAEFLKKVGVDPGAAILPTNSLASAMVDTLESIRKKKAAEEEKRRRKEKRRRRERRDYEDEAEKSHRKSKRRKNKSSDEEDSSDGPKRKKRKKDKKTSKKKRKRSEPTEIQEEEDQPLPSTIDLSSTLKELRTNSPTKNLIIPDVEIHADSDDSEREEKREEKSQEGVKKKREYSEGEWSSDSEGDSFSDDSMRDE